MSTKRIAKDLAQLSQAPPAGYTNHPTASLHTWHLTYSPPPSSPFHPGRFGILVSLPASYPFKPPSIRFITRVYHPNVTNDSLGNICLGMLKADAWKPSTSLNSVLEAVGNLLVEPVPDDPLEEKIAHEYRTDRGAWEENVRAHVKRYAMGEPEFPEFIVDDV